jgi:hypothetical protein
MHAVGVGSLWKYRMDLIAFGAVTTPTSLHHFGTLFTMAVSKAFQSDECATINRQQRKSEGNDVLDNRQR